MLKRLIAMLTAIALVVGLIVVPTEAEAEEVEYKNMTVSSFYTDGGAWFEPTLSNGNWRVYIKTSAAVPEGTYNLTMSNGTEKITVPFWKDGAADNVIGTETIPQTFLDGSKAQTITIESGKYQAQLNEVSKEYGIEITENFVFYVNGYSWATNQSALAADLEQEVILTYDSQYSNEKAVYFKADIPDGMYSKDDGATLSAPSSPTDGSVLYGGGVWIEGENSRANLSLVRYDEGTGNGCYYLYVGSAQEGKTYTIRGMLQDKAGHKVRYSSVSVKWDGQAWSQVESDVSGNPIEPGEQAVLTFDEETNNGGDTKGVYLLTTDGFTVDGTWTWEKNPVAVNDADSGIFLNGTKIDAPFFRYDTGKAYVGLVNAEITAKDKDELVIKGTFEQNGRKESYKEIKLYFNGQVWGTTYVEPVKVTYTDITLKEMHEVSGYKADNARWDIYLTTQGTLPGEVDKIRFKDIKVTVDGKEYTTGAFHAFDGTFFIVLDNTILPQKLTKNTEVVIKAGKYDSDDVSKGINIKADYVLYANQYGISDKGYLKKTTANETDVKLSIDREVSYGGDEKGMYLLTGDKFPVDDTWQSSIRAVSYDENSGVFLNGKKIDAVVKKFQDGKMYVGLIDAGVTAKDGDKLEIKGVFALGDYAVSYAEHTFYYNGKTWNTTYFQQKVTYTDIVLKEMHEVSGYRADNERWDIYLTTKGKLPGEVDKVRFKDVKVTVDGKEYLTGAFHAFDGTFFIVLDNTILPQKLTKNTKVIIKAGKYVAEDGSNGIDLKKDYVLYANQYGISDKGYLKKVTANEKDVKLSIDREISYGGDANGMYLLTGDKFPVDDTWQTSIRAVSYDAKSGVFLNGKKIDAVLKKFQDGKIYVGLIDGGVTAEDGDKLEIKGLFAAGDYAVSFAEHTFYYNGKTWNTTYFKQNTTYTDITLNGMHESSKYREEFNRWDIYFTTNGTLPGEVDKVRFKDVKVTVGGKEYTTGAFHAFDDTFFIVLEDTILPKKLKKDTKVVIKAGKYVAEDGSNGINLKKDYVLYANQYGISDKGFLSETIPNETGIELTIDREILFGGDGKGVYLLTGDSFPVDDTWQESIRAVSYDDNSGVFLNGKKVDAVLKKFQDGKIYVGLVDGGVTAEDGDKLEIKGLFALGDYAVSYAEHTFYYNGKTWNTTYFQQQEEYTSVSGTHVSEVSWFDDEAGRWNIYIDVDTKLPGEIDKMYFEGLQVAVNGKILESSTVWHGYEGKLYVPILEEDLPKDAENGIEIVVKAGSAMGSDRIHGIQWTQDFAFYTFMGALIDERPTTDTKYLEVSDISLFKTATYREEWEVWQVFIAVKETFETEGGTTYYKLPIDINGQTHYVDAIQSGTNLCFDVTKEMLSPDAKNGVLTIKEGATAIANAGKNGVRINDTLEIYLFNRTWSEKQYTDVTTVDCKLIGVQDSTYVKAEDGNAYTNLYVWTDTKMPGTPWYEAYLVPVLYNGEQMTVQMEKVVSTFGRLMYFGLSGTPKDGDIVKFTAGTEAVAGGLGFTIQNDYSLVYRNGLWSEYVETDVEAPADDKSLWDVARFDGAYIPYTKNGVVTFSNTDQYNVIRSMEPMKDYTISFTARKLDDSNEALPNFTLLLRANAIDEETEISKTALYGYVISFYYGQLSLFKNGENWELIDTYRLSYEPLETDEKFFEFGEDYNYEVSIYNVTDTCACITFSVNGVEQIRYYDHASDDPMDPVLNAGDFRIYADCTTTISDDVSKTEEILLSADTCETNKGVYVAASYPYVAEDTELVADGSGAFIEDGVFKATEAGTYTISGTYKGETVAAKTIVVTEAEKKNEAENEATYEEIVVINWPVVIALIAAVVVVIAGACIVIVVVVKKRKKGNGKGKGEGAA